MGTLLAVERTCSGPCGRRPIERRQSSSPPVASWSLRVESEPEPGPDVELEPDVVPEPNVVSEPDVVSGLGAADEVRLAHLSMFSAT